MIKGLFEIHVTVDHTTPTGLCDLVTFTLPRPDVKRIFAVGTRGVWPNQYMISKWTNGTLDKAVDRAMTLAEEMRKHGLVIKRVKVEAMAHNEGVPVSSGPDPVLGYFEFHGKISLPPGKSFAAFDADCTRLAGLLDKKTTTVGTSFNLTGKSGAPLVTVRVHGRGRLHAIEQKDILLEALKDAGYDIIGDLQSEYAVMDNNKALDDGWMIYPDQ